MTKLSTCETAQHTMGKHSTNCMSILNRFTINLRVLVAGCITAWLLSSVFCWSCGIQLFSGDLHCGVFEAGGSHVVLGRTMDAVMGLGFSSLHALDDRGFGLFTVAFLPQRLPSPVRHREGGGDEHNREGDGYSTITTCLEQIHIYSTTIAYDDVQLLERTNESGPNEKGDSI